MSDKEDEELNSEEEEEEEDSEEEEETSSKRSRKKRRKEINPAHFFLDTEAVDDEDDEEEEDGDEAEDGFIEKSHHRAGDDSVRMDLYRKRPNILDKSVEELTKEVEDRYKHYLDDDENEEDLGDEGQDIKQQSLLPGVLDPKLWMVKCKLGKERSTVVSLMQKFIDKEHEEDRLLIKSAICPEHLKGYIYIEAEKESHVKSAIQGLRNLQSWGLKLVPIKEMPDVLTVTKKHVALQRTDWVRVKRGVYRGDIGQVYDSDEARGRVTVKLIPRLNYQNLLDSKKKGAQRMPARFFNAEEAAVFGGNALERKKESTGDVYYVVDGNKYKDGYLLKVMNIKSLETQGVLPTLDEIQKFQEKPTAEKDEDGNPIVSQVNPNTNFNLSNVNIKKKRKITFVKGDLVKIIDGDLKNLMGVVESTGDDDTVTIMPKFEGLNEALTLPAHQLQKHFKMGDHIKVIDGQFEGETGLILRVDENSVIFFSDLTSKEIKVLSSDIQECSDVTSGKLQLGNYELHDLVQINPQSVGVIVKVERDSFKVLDNNGNIQSVLLQEIGNKRNMKGAVSFDAHQNQIGVGDVVQVKEGQYKGRQGTIKHIWKYFAFLHSRDMLDNSGIFVVRTGYCAMLGGMRGGNKPREFNAGPNNFPPMSPGNFNGQRRNNNNNGRNNVGGSPSVNKRRRDDSLLNKTVIINTGQWKGYYGIVKDATDTTARVELHTNCKTVTVNRSNIYVKEDKDRMNVDSGNNNNDWDYGSKTPMHGDMGSRTPMRGDNDWGFGSSTPLRTAPGTPGRYTGSSTPQSGTVWDANQPNTPIRPNTSWEDSYSSQSSSGSSWTPSNEYGSSITTPGSNYASSSFSPYGNFSDRDRDRDRDTYTPSISEPNPPTPGAVFTPSSHSDQKTPQFSYHRDEVSTPGQSDISTPTPFSGNQGPMTPSTPGSNQPMTPSTPTQHLNDYSNTTENSIEKEDPNYWLSVDIAVKISNDFKNGQYKDVIQAVIKQVSPNRDSCKVSVGSGDTVSIPSEYLSLIIPKRRDNVKVIKGEFEGATGTVIGIDGADGIVKMSSNLDIKILDLHSIAVYLP